MIFCVHVIQYLKAKDNFLQDYIAFENIVLVEADNVEEVEIKIRKMYENYPQEQWTYRGRLAEYVYGGIRSIMEVSDYKKSNLKKGIEISYNQIYIKNKKRLKELIIGNEVNLDYLQNYYSDDMFDTVEKNIDSSITKLENKKKLTLDDYFELGELYFKNSDYRKAIEKFNIVIEMDPDFHLRAYEKRGDCYYFLNEFDNSLTDYKMDLKISRTLDFYMFKKRARIYKIFKDYNSLLEDIKITSNRTDSYQYKYNINFEKAGVLLKLKRFEEARELYQYCIDKKIREKRCYIGLLRIYIAYNKLESIREIDIKLNNKSVNKLLIKNGWKIN